MEMQWRYKHIELNNITANPTGTITRIWFHISRLIHLHIRIHLPLPCISLPPSPFLKIKIGYQNSAKGSAVWSKPCSIDARKKNSKP